MADYPFGGLNSINPIYYMHNLWLDVYAVSGILAFLLLVIFTVRIFIMIYKLVRHAKVGMEFKIFIIGVYSSFFLLFMTEPVLLASPWFFLTFCLIAGMTDKYHDSLDSITRSSLKESFQTNQNLEAIT
jgi:O-antigen ligase